MERIDDSLGLLGYATRPRQPFYRSLSRRVVVARKAYRCLWCKDGIEVGERHVKEAQILDGDFYMIRAHIACWRREFPRDVIQGYNA